MTALSSMQTTLAAEHAAIYVFGVLAAQTSQSGEGSLWDRLDTAYRLHRGRRDDLTLRITRRNAEPVAAEVSYALPNPAATPVQVKAAALTLETRLAATYADLVGSTEAADRAWAIKALDDCAVRQLGFGARPTSFPGLPSAGGA